MWNIHFLTRRPERQGPKTLTPNFSNLSFNPTDRPFGKFPCLGLRKHCHCAASTSMAVIANTASHTDMPMSYMGEKHKLEGHPQAIYGGEWLSRPMIKAFYGVKY